jgi:hypothetical protein
LAQRELPYPIFLSLIRRLSLPQVEAVGVLHVLREKPGAAGLLGGTDDERVPEGEVVEAVQADGSEDIGNVGSGWNSARSPTLQRAMEGSTRNLRVTVTKYPCKIRSETTPCWRGDVRLQAGRHALLGEGALSSEATRILVSKKLRAGTVLPGMNLVSIEASPARVALTGQAL